MTELRLEKGRQKRIEAGHPWVYKTEIDSVKKENDNDFIADITNFKGKFIGRGFYNPLSMITLRILTRHGDEKIDEIMIRERVRKAWSYRQKIFGCESPKACRIIFGEADFLPGVIADKFGDVLVLQSLCLGADKWERVICDQLVNLIKPTAVFARNDQLVREKEGLPLKKEFLYGECPDIVTFEENGINMYADIQNGQKTGYFLDQRENRLAIKPYVKEKKVLDCFCHTGSFALHAAFFGAEHVTGVDISGEALEMARKNAELNRLKNVEFLEANVFDYLRQEDINNKYDVIILDPPAFTKSKNAVEGAIRGYKEINLRAMKLIKSGGFLITNSCSYHFNEEMFLETIRQAAFDAKKEIRMAGLYRQSPDHPMLPGYPESYYLKCAVVEVN